MRFVFVAIAAVAFVTLTGPVAAGGGEGGRELVRHIFDAADKDGSGSLTRAEYAEARLERFGVSFEDCDANADGETSMAEYLDLYDRHHSEQDRI